MSDQTFPQGIIFKLPSDKSPDFVKGSISIKKGEFIDYLNTQTGEWVNIKLLLSKGGKAYCQLDTWKPKETSTSETPDNSNDDSSNDLPF